MARDNHPRERQARALKRKQASRPPYDRVLIVCEGSKTEPLYFEDIRIANHVPTLHVTILHGEYGTEPAQIVDFAVDVFKQTRAYEWVITVFDRDAHLTYYEALAKAERFDSALKNDEKQSVRFLAVPSVPCFELWLLLHYEDIRAPLARDEAISRLRTRIQGYEKGADGIYKTTLPFLPDAVKRAKWLQGHFNARDGQDPFTAVDDVVNLLQNIRASKSR